MCRRRIPLALALVSALFASTSQAGPVILFETNAGSFVMDVNPTDDPNLQVHVDNIVQYIDTNRYIGMVINRAQEDFVVQMGGFLTDTLDPASIGQVGSSNENGFPRVPAFDPVIVDADNDGAVDFPTLSNTVGAVSLALSGDPDSGTSSFFVNLNDNSGPPPNLDALGFVPFAEIRDLAFFDNLNAATGDFGRLNLRDANPTFTNNLGYQDVPTFQDELIVVEQALLIPEPTTTVLVLGGVLIGVSSSRRR